MAVDLDELRNMAQDELEVKSNELKRRLLDLRVELSTGKLDKHHRIQEVRRDIARVFTVQSELKNKQTAESKK